jgi:hypothetical protein
MVYSLGLSRYMREANGTSTMLRACLIASVNRFW